MTVKQISLITMKSGEKVNLPDSLDEAEICFTTDTGEVFIGAPNFGPVQFRSDKATKSNGQGISPYRNIKILTEFDVTQAITGEYFTQGPLVNTVLPLTSTPYTVHTFDKGINSAIVSYSLYDGKNVNLVGDLYICTFGGNVTVCLAGMKDDGITFSAVINSTNQIVLQATNTTSSKYTIYISAKCWESSLATWDGDKGNGVSPTCFAGATIVPADKTRVAIAVCDDVDEGTGPSDGQVLQFSSSKDKWIPVTLNLTPPTIVQSIANCIDVAHKQTNGQVLVWSESTKLWEPTTLDLTPKSTPPSIATCTDVNYNGSQPTGSDILVFNGSDSKWELASIKNMIPTPGVKVCISALGGLNSSEKLGGFCADNTYTYGKNFAGSTAFSRTPPGSSYALMIMQDVLTGAASFTTKHIGTITFASGKTPTFSGSPVTINTGDVIYVTTPSAIDTGITDVFITIDLTPLSGRAL